MRNTFDLGKTNFEILIDIRVTCCRLSLRFYLRSNFLRAFFTCTPKQLYIKTSIIKFSTSTPNNVPLRDDQLETE